MKLEPYPEYKDSGVELVGEIPEGWEAKKLKYSAVISNDKLNKKPNNLSYVGLEHIESWTGKLIGNEIEEVDSSVNIFHKGNILFGKLRPYLAKVIETHFDGVCTSELVVFKVNKDVNSRFVFHQLLSHRFINIVNALTYGVKMPRANPHQIENMVIYVPPLGEQEKISSYLDKKTSEIDLTIEKDTRLIELLKEKRTSLINHVVTKGLDPMVKMKDSGVEWIGEIPEDWEISYINRYADVTKLAGFEFSKYIKYVPNGEIIALRALNLLDGKIVFNDIKRISEEVSDKLPRSKLKKGDLVLTYVGAKVGAVAIVPEDNKYHLAPNICKIVNKKTAELKTIFLMYYLLSSSGKNELLFYVSKSGQEVISMAKIRKIRIIIPSIDEQDRIIKFLDYKVSKIDLIIKKIQENIKLLEEYKKSLIHHVVTGKVDVREVAV